MLILNFFQFIILDAASVLTNSQPYTLKGIMP